MLVPLLRQSLYELRWQVVVWGIGFGLLLLLTIALYPSVSSAYSDIWAQLPQEWLAFFGNTASLDTPEGYLSAEFFSYAPLVLAIFAILGGTAALAGEEGRGSLDLLLAQPVNRWKVVTAKCIGLVISLGVVVAIVTGLFWVGVWFAGVEISGGREVNALLLLWPFETAVAFLAVFLTMLLPGRLLAGSVLAVYLVASYILESLSHLVSALEPLRPLFLTTYYEGRNALGAHVSWTDTGVVLGFIVLALGLSILLFQRRDIGTHKRVMLPQFLIWWQARVAGGR